MCFSSSTIPEVDKIPLDVFSSTCHVVPGRDTHLQDNSERSDGPIPAADKRPGGEHGLQFADRHDAPEANYPSSQVGRADCVGGSSAAFDLI